ncbi:MAG TPA: PAS domain S-box protein [Bacillota bacterium]|nr:PAS domain S-box protein [Bacillota bacterium]
MKRLSCRRVFVGIVICFGFSKLLIDILGHHYGFCNLLLNNQWVHTVFEFLIDIGFIYLLFVRKSFAEKALKNSERRFQDLFEATTDIFFTLSSKGHFTMINHLFQSVTGFPRETWLGKSWFPLIHPMYQDKVRHLFDSLITNGHGMTIEVPICCKSNEIIICEITLTPYLRGQRLKLVYGAMRDITARKITEEALQAQNERLAVTLRSIGDGVIATDIQGNVVLINPVAERLTGWNQEEALGKHLSQIFHIVNDHTQEPCENPIKNILDNGQSVGLTKNTVLVSRNQKDRYYISSNGSPIRDTQGKIIGAVLVFRDISERRRAEEEMLKTQKLESIGILAGGIAHDFNNILSGILANTQFAKMMIKKGKNVEKYLDSMEETIFRAVSLTRQLLTFSKGGAPVKKVVSIGELIKTTVEFSLRGSNSICEFAIDDDLWLVEIDPGQISQVLNNLVINADQAMPDGGIIRVMAHNVMKTREDSMFPEGKYVKISVIDHGIGIAEEHLPYIFDPYFTTKVNGNGLGLATSYAIIKKHDGYIEVQSQPNKGTIINIYLPAKEGTTADWGKRTGLIPGHGRILFMDDDPLIRNGVKEMLREIGYEVDLAKDGAELLEMFKKNFYDAVITDLTIPGGMGGKTIIQKLLKLDPKVKVIISSGYSNNPIMAEYRKYGFCGVVVKPYQIEELSRVLSEVLSDSSPLENFHTPSPL